MYDKDDQYKCGMRVQTRERGGAVDLQVFEIRLKVYLLEDIPVEAVQKKTAALIDICLSRDEELLEFHETNQFKNYSFGNPYPLEKDKVYKKNKVYVITIRTIDPYLAKVFSEKLIHERSEEMQALTCENKVIPKKNKIIDTIYSISPVIVKAERYWRGVFSLEEYEKRLTVNLIKKYNAFCDTKINEDFEFIRMIEVQNRTPITVAYKKIKLLGDKIVLKVADNELSQELSYMALGTGLGEINARGAGFVNYRWM